jgi:hypothetical protein
VAAFPSKNPTAIDGISWVSGKAQSATVDAVGIRYFATGSAQKWRSVPTRSAPYETAGIEHDGVESDGARQQGAILDDGSDQRLSRRRLAGVGDANQQGEREIDLDPRQSPECHGGKDGSEHSEAGVDEYQRPHAREPVDQMARDGGDEEMGDLKQESGQAEQKHRACQSVDEPSQGDLLHPAPEHGDRLASGKNAKARLRECGRQEALNRRHDAAWIVSAGNVGKY